MSRSSPGAAARAATFDPKEAEGNPTSGSYRATPYALHLKDPRLCP